MTHEKQKRYREKYPERVKESARRWREKNPERVKEVKRAYYERNAELLRAKRRKYRMEQGEKERARWTLNNALRDGMIVRGTCEIGVDCHGRIEGHHEDYARPLEVRWLCQRHHTLEHL